MKVTINKIIIVLVLFLSLINNAKAEIYNSLPIYGKAKYESEFTNFAYVNANAPKYGRIVQPGYGTFDNFNPFIFKGIAAGEAALLTLDTLGVIPADDYATVYPLIAKNFEVPADKSFIGFILDERAKFQDGSEVTADDVIYSYNALISKGSPLYKIYYADVEKVVKVNRHHVRFYFKKGTKNKELPLILAQLSIYSAKYWKDKDFSKPFLEQPLSSGPYKIAKFEAGKFIELQRNKNYWAKDLPSRRGFFNFDEIRIDYYQDTTVTLQALFAGNIDWREEYIAKNWVTGYHNDLVNSGKIIKKEIPHNRAATLQNFAFNIRRPQLQDRRVRQAIGLAFNFEWSNDKLFYNQYKRLNSYFTNTEMEATGKPHGNELKILQKFARELPREVFGKVPVQPIFKDYKQTRQNLKKAVKLLNEAGYDFVDGKMTNLKNGQALELEILSNTANGSSFTRVMLPFLKNLEKIGIKAKFRNLEVSIFKNRLDSFDFDMAIISFPISQMPGNELKEMFGSQAADIKGSMNLIGIKNTVIDELIEKIVQANQKQEYIDYIKSLDRVLRNEYYIIPHWYSSYQRVAHNKRLSAPKSRIKVGFQPYTWWLHDKGETE